MYGLRVAEEVHLRDRRQHPGRLPDPSGHASVALWRSPYFVVVAAISPSSGELRYLRVLLKRPAKLIPFPSFVG